MSDRTAPKHSGPAARARIASPDHADTLRLVGRAIFGTLLLALIGGCATTLPDRDQRMQRAYVYYLDGAGGGEKLSNYSSGVRQGLLAAGYDGAAEMFTWETGLGIVADQTASLEYKRKKAGELAQRIADFSQQHPQTPLYVIGLSAGTLIAVYTLEALPDDVQVENVILLSGSFSADYDVTKALRRVRGKMYVFTSHRDGMLLFLEPLFGTADRRYDGPGPIGVRGLQVPAGASAVTCAQYTKVVNIPWREDFTRVGEYGRHFDAVRAPFIRSYVAPLIARGSAPGIAVAAAAGAIENPDYARWARFGVGSSTTFEGYQVINGVRQPVRMMVTLMARHADHLLVQREFTPLEGTEREPSTVRQAFVPARIRPEQHPLTHPQATIQELPRAQIKLGPQILDCDVTSIRAVGDFTEWGHDVTACVWSNSEIPGGVAGVDMKAALDAGPIEFSGRVVAVAVVSP